MFGVVSRILKETEGEKCPRCLEIPSDFMVVSEGLWGCFKCGCVFVPKRQRIVELEAKKGLVEAKLAPTRMFVEQEPVVEKPQESSLKTKKRGRPRGTKS